MCIHVIGLDYLSQGFNDSLKSQVIVVRGMELQTANEAEFALPFHTAGNNPYACEYLSLHQNAHEIKQWRFL